MTAETRELAQLWVLSAQALEVAKVLEAQAWMAYEEARKQAREAGAREKALA